MRFTTVFKMRSAASIACMAGFSLFCGRAAMAAVVLPVTGGFGFPDGDAAGFSGPGPTEVLLADITSPTEATSIGSGGVTYDLKFNIETKIYRDLPAGTIDFVYQLNNVSDNNQSTTFGDSITRLTLQSFAGYTTTADYIYGTGHSPAGGDGGADAPPLEVDRSTLPGAVVGFDFAYASTPTTLIPGTYSDFLVVRTNSTTYTTGTASVIGGLGESSPVQVPYGAAVPEPASVGAMAVAGVSILARRRRVSR